MHACGHDAHTAIALGAATLLAQSFPDGALNGTVKFLFQPAEERSDEHGSTGAPYMIKEGVLDDVDAVLRSEEHTSELQSRGHLVCRLLLEKKNETHHILR